MPTPEAYSVALRSRARERFATLIVRPWLASRKQLIAYLKILALPDALKLKLQKHFGAFVWATGELGID